MGRDLLNNELQMIFFFYSLGQYLFPKAGGNKRAKINLCISDKVH